MGHHNIDPSQKHKMLFIGDRPDTDIALGNNGNVDTCLVLTGVVASIEEAEMWAQKDEKFKATWVMNSFGEA
jgi:ribonucleotide monophosphatase NagD (HAD superfamily)